MERFDSIVTRERIVYVALLLCVTNLLLVGALTATGTLKTAERGDIERVHTTNVGGERVTLPAERSGFVIENPTDVDVFYNIVRYVDNGGRLYDGNGYDPFVQLTYNYTPALYPVFVLLTAGGYVLFKFLWLLLSVLATVGGTAALLDAERWHLNANFSDISIVAVSVASVGFQPMVTNFKVGQTTPLMYLFVGASWWLLRRRKDGWSGAAIVGTALFKPYFIAPIAVGGRRGYRRMLLGFGMAFLLLNLLSVFAFDAQSLLEYYLKLYRFITAEGAPVSYDRFADWSPTHVRPFYWLGPAEVVVRGAFVLTTLVAAALHALGVEDEPLGVYAVSLTSILLGLRTATGVDMAMLLAPLVLLGVWLYDRDSWLLTVLLGSFVSFMAHEYVLEVLVGAGTAVPAIAANERLVISLLPILQPANYGVLLLFFVGLLRFRAFRDRLPAALDP